MSSPVEEQSPLLAPEAELADDGSSEEEEALLLLNSTALDCPSDTDEQGREVDDLAFWIEGVVLCVIAVFGLIGNTASGLILSR